MRAEPIEKMVAWAERPLIERRLLGDAATVRENASMAARERGRSRFRASVTAKPLASSEALRSRMFFGIGGRSCCAGYSLLPSSKARRTSSTGPVGAPGAANSSQRLLRQPLVSTPACRSTASACSPTGPRKPPSTGSATPDATQWPTSSSSRRSRRRSRSSAPRPGIAPRSPQRSPPRPQRAGARARHGRANRSAPRHRSGAGDAASASRAVRPSPRRRSQRALRWCA